MEIENTKFGLTQGRSKLWKNRNFTKMFAAYTFSTFGDWFDGIAVMVLVTYRWGADPIQLSFIPVAMALPGLFLGSFAGAVADRMHKIRLMIRCDILTALLTVAVLAAPDIYVLVPLLALRAAMGLFHLPAQQGLTRRIVAEEDLLQASALNGFVNQCSKIAGPLLGAITLTIFAPQACILLNAFTRLCAVVLLWGLRRVKQDTSRSDLNMATDSNVENTGFLDEWREGWIFLLQSKQVLNTLIFGFFGFMAIMMIDYQFSTLLQKVAPGNESLVGWLIAAAGAGAAVTLLLLNRMNQISCGWGLGGGYLIIGMAIALMGMQNTGANPARMVSFGGLMGIGNGLFMLTQNVVLQKETPKQIIGRVFGIQQTILSLLMIASPLLGGILIRSIGVGKAFVVLGLVTGGIGFLGITFQTKFWPSSGSSKPVTPETQMSG